MNVPSGKVWQPTGDAPASSHRRGGCLAGGGGVDDAGAVGLERVDPVRGNAEGFVEAARLCVADDDRVQEVRAEVGDVLGGLRTVVLVLVLQTDDRLVDERETEARDLDPGA